MFGSKSKQIIETESKGANWFDGFELRLGDLMRGERATRGLSLLDVQRDLRIKASYIAAIENADPTAFETPGFIAGYVRSYARYLGMDPDKAYSEFCAESGFSSAHPLKMGASPSQGTGAASNSSQSSLDQFPLRSVKLCSKVLYRIKQVLYAVFYPILLAFDLLIWLQGMLTSREAGSDRSFQSAHPTTTDWWAFFSIGLGGLFGILFYFSEFGYQVADLPTRAMFSIAFALVVSAILAWFHPKLFFARLTLSLAAPLFFASVLGAQLSLEAGGQYFGGYLQVGTPADPVSTLVLGLLCTMAMFYHRNS